MAKEPEYLIRSRHYTTWQLLKLYWLSRVRLSAFLFVIGIFLLTIVLVGMDVIFNYWYGFFYNALQAYDKTATIRLLVIFFVIAGFYIVVAVYRYYISQLFGLRWRRWLTDQYLHRWLEKRGYYYLETFDEKTDNPDQRIQEDIGSLVLNSIELSMGIVAAVTTFLAFIYILWTLSGVITLSFGAWGSIKLPGYLVWVGLLYALFGTFFTFKIGKPLVALNFEQQRREATFRYSAIDLRTHAEHVALYRGEHHQKSILDYVFGRVLDNYYLIILRQKLLLWFTAGYNQISVLLPLLVALPNYFDKVFLLGGLIQSLQAFNKVQESLSYLINAFPQIAQWRAINQRLTTFVNHLIDIERKVKKYDALTFIEKAENKIEVKNVSIYTPREDLLLKNINEKFIHGEHYLIQGDSGIGKSTFIRTLAGIWPYAEGKIIFPEGANTMYLPQKPYMPLGTLAEAILFPDFENQNLVDKLAEVLRECHLAHLIPRLREIAPWSQQLSPGELQRVALARVLLHQPEWVFLDEATSMLDVENEEYFYKKLHDTVPNCSMVSVGHHIRLKIFHKHVIDMTRYRPE